MKQCFAFISVLLLTACEKKVDIPVPYGGDRIVVNALLQPDSVMYVRITRSQPPGASTFPEIPGARVTVNEGGNAVPLQWQVVNGKGYFVSQAPVNAALPYSISVAAEGLDTVTAADVMPRRPVLTEPYAQSGGNRVKFVLKDLPGRDFYRFRLFAGQLSATHRAVPVKRLRYRFDPSYNNSFTDLITDNYLESTLISDNRFDGRDITIVMQTEQVANAGEILILEVAGLSDHTWRYLKSMELHSAYEGNLLAEQSRVHTNVEGGYGIFGGINAAYLNIEVK